MKSLTSSNPGERREKRRGSLGAVLASLSAGLSVSRAQNPLCCFQGISRIPELGLELCLAAPGDLGTICPCQDTLGLCRVKNFSAAVTLLELRWG